jgi:outer membrane protein OmpA-like peptidoglycan-associated protein
MASPSARPLILSALLALSPLVDARTMATAQSNAPNTQQMIEALRPTKTTRGIAAAGAESKARAIEEDRIIQELSAKATRGLSRPERAQLAETVENRPKIDLEINFAFNAAETSEAVRPVLLELGRAMTSPELKGAKFLVAGHTDAKGSDAYNQKLSEKRAKAVKDFLMANFDLGEEQLVAVGYGEERLKNSRKPFADENRRVQVVNISPTVAATNR